MSASEPPFFIGWGKTAAPDRRLLLTAAAGLAIGAGALGFALGPGLRPGDGGWDQSDVREWTGLLMREPYPILVLDGREGAGRTALLAQSGKASVAARLPPGLEGRVMVRASPIVRGRRIMLAVVDAPDAIQGMTDAPLPAPTPIDHGEVMLAGEILDAKCWLGAMRPGYGKTHKACAALCAEGGLPLAFCAAGECGTADDAFLFVDETGKPHGRPILPLVADPVIATGRMVEVGDLMTFRVALKDLRRL